MSREIKNSLTLIDLRRLLADLCRIDDELEGISVLTLFHQFQVDQPPGVCQRFALWKSFRRGPEQVCSQFKLAICHKAIYSTCNLVLRDAEVIDQQLCTVCVAEMVEAL